MLVPLGDTYYFCFTTRQFSTGAPFTLAGTPALSVKEEGNDTVITSGVSLDVDTVTGGVTGLNEGAVVASSGNGYEVGKYYSVYISTGTVDSVSVVGEVVGHFRVVAAENSAGIPRTDLEEVDGNAAAAGRLRQWITSWTTGTVQSDAGTTVTLDAGGSSVDDFYKGDLILVHAGTGAGQARFIASYTGSSNEATLSVAFATSLASDSDYVIIPSGTPNIEAIGGSTTTVDNLTTVFSTDFATNYDATNNIYNVHIKYVAGEQVDGAGTEADPWGPA